MRPAWWLLCLLHLVPGGAALVDPLWFAQQVAGVATNTAHFARDVGVGELTLAVAAAVAALRPNARLPVAAVLGAQLVLHALSHVLDRSAASAQANALVTVALALQALLLAAVTRRALRGQRSPHRADALRPPTRPTAPRTTTR